MKRNPGVLEETLGKVTNNEPSILQGTLDLFMGLSYTNPDFTYYKIWGWLSEVSDWCFRYYLCALNDQLPNCSRMSLDSLAVMECSGCRDTCSSISLFAWVPGILWERSLATCRLVCWTRGPHRKWSEKRGEGSQSSGRIRRRGWEPAVQGDVVPTAPQSALYPPTHPSGPMCFGSGGRGGLRVGEWSVRADQAYWLKICRQSDTVVLEGSPRAEAPQGEKPQ